MNSDVSSESNTASANTELDRTAGGSVWALSRYVFAATLVRSADGGAVVAIVHGALLAVAALLMSLTWPLSPFRTKLRRQSQERFRHRLGRCGRSG